MGAIRCNLYFETKSGLLARVVRYADSPVGLNPTQIDYADYRDVAGVRMPYRMTVTWLDGKANTMLSEIQPNVPIDAARFTKPAPQNSGVTLESYAASDDREPWIVPQLRPYVSSWRS